MGYRNLLCLILRCVSNYWDRFVWQICQTFGGKTRKVVLISRCELTVVYDRDHWIFMLSFEGIINIWAEIVTTFRVLPLMHLIVLVIVVRVNDRLIGKLWRRMIFCFRI